MRISAKVDYAVRACAELSVRSPTRASGLTKGEQLGDVQDIPTRYLENILAELRRAGIVQSQRGSDGGYWLARPADKVSIADIIRAVEGPLADVRGEPPENLEYQGAATALERVWMATRAAVRAVLETTTLANITSSELAPEVEALLEDPGAQTRR